MSMLPAPIVAAERHLAGLDPVIAELVSRNGPCTLRPRAQARSHFEALARAIVFQQLAGKAASAIYGRFRALVPGRLTPAAVLALPDDLLRGAGLSGNKAAALRDLAASAVEGRLDRLATLDDEEVVVRLSAVRGIGRWTAEMFLMFQLGRLDVWPVGDLGVRNGYARAWRLPAPPTPRELEPLGERFRPYRSVAAWYCWRAVETEPPEV